MSSQRRRKVNIDELLRDGAAGRSHKTTEEKLKLAAKEDDDIRFVKCDDSKVLRPKIDFDKVIVLRPDAEVIPREELERYRRAVRSAGAKSTESETRDTSTQKKRRNRKKKPATKTN
ncbi:hypothetical protein AAVH_37197 [Aphelenchoides avenae]|nr:hypothetical protein AAVH_37197 [Aphelenchus avenae]